MSWLNLLTWSYWFNQPYIARGSVMWFWVSSFLALVLFGLVAKIIQSALAAGRPGKESWRRFGNLFFTTGFIGLVWMFFRQERVAFLAWRFWLILWLAVFLWWFIKNILYTVRRLPRIKEEKEKREEMEKYLPKKR